MEMANSSSRGLERAGGEDLEDEREWEIINLLDTDAEREGVLSDKTKLEKMNSSREDEGREGRAIINETKHPPPQTGL